MRRYCECFKCEKNLYGKCKSKEKLVIDIHGKCKQRKDVKEKFYVD